MSKNVLFLGFWTPPIIRPRAIMAGKIIPEMMRQGLNPVLVTYDICGHWDVGLPVYTVPVFGIKNQNSLICKIPIASKGNTLWQEHLYFEELFSKVSDIIRKHNINLVFSFSNPQASNILGALIKKRLGIKFISHFSDPWYDNPYRESGLLQSVKIFFQEKFIVKWSDKIIFTNDQAMHLVMRKYPHYISKAFISSHCFSKKDYPEVHKNEVDNKFIIAHIGVFYKQRTPETLFKSVSKVLSSNPNVAKKLKIVLIGATDKYTSYTKETLNLLIKKYNLENIVEIISQVEYRESLRYMKEADCLVVIDAPGDISPFLPSKIIDYAGSGTTILGITPSDSPTAEFLKKANFKSFNHEEIKGLSSFLLNLITGKCHPIVNRKFVESYEARPVVANLLNHFEKI